MYMYTSSVNVLAQLESTLHFLEWKSQFSDVTSRSSQRNGKHGEGKIFCLAFYSYCLAMRSPLQSWVIMAMIPTFETHTGRYVVNNVNCKTYEALATGMRNYLL